MDDLKTEQADIERELAVRPDLFLPLASSLLLTERFADGPWYTDESKEDQLVKRYLISSFRNDRSEANSI